MATKKIFIVPAFMFFVVYYFALPVLVGYAPQFMSTKVWAGEPRLSVCAVAIFCGVDHRGAVCARRPTILIGWRKTFSKKPKTHKGGK